MAAPALSQGLLALFDANGVKGSDRMNDFKTFLKDNGCLSVEDFASACAKEELIDANIIDACGVQNFTWGEKLAIKKSWRQSRKASAIGATPTSGSGSKNTMPEGMEAHLLEVWKKSHGFNMMGSWLLHEEIMSKIFYKLAAKPRALFVPDLRSLCRKSNLSQKPWLVR